MYRGNGSVKLEVNATWSRVERKRNRVSRSLRNSKNPGVRVTPSTFDLHSYPDRINAPSFFFQFSAVILFPPGENLYFLISPCNAFVFHFLSLSFSLACLFCSYPFVLFASVQANSNDCARLFQYFRFN